MLIFWLSVADGLSFSSRNDLSRASARVDKQYSASLQKAALLVKATGCWAGREYKFSRSTGEAMPLDNIPDELSEWSTYYSYETFVKDERNAKRTTYLVEPEAGCAADEVSVSPRSSGVDLDDAQICARGDVHVVDSRRFPSGETCATLVQAPPFIDARTLFYRGEDRRLRLETKIDPSRATLLSCSLSIESRIECDESPFRAPLALGNPRATGFDASLVARLCGSCLAEKTTSRATFDEDGSATFRLLDMLSFDLKPLDDTASTQLVVSYDNYVLSRTYDQMGTLVDVDLETR